MTRVEAFAKVTLSLRVVGVRADDFHELEAFSVSVTAPRDVLELTDAPVTTIEVTGPFAAGVPTDDGNLVARALQVLDRPMRVVLEKGIPPGAGLGGGSADAAAVLAAFGGSAAQAAAIGSDVPFARQRLPAWMRGRGEILEPVPDLPPLDLVIAAPEFGCSTPDVYRAWDALGGPASTRTIPAPVGFPGPFVNDLEPAAEHVQPGLRAFRERVEAAFNRAALLCGSGSAYAAWFADVDAAAAAADRARVAVGPDRVWHGRTIVE